MEIAKNELQKKKFGLNLRIRTDKSDAPTRVYLGTAEAAEFGPEVENPIISK